MMAFSLVSAWNKRRRRKKSSHLNDHHQTTTDDPWIYRPVQLWQLEDQTPLERPSKRHHGSAVFTLREMEDATSSFSDANLLGKGGFGRVYRGTLRSGESHSNSFQSFEKLKN
uniref:Protein kinase domain-containing protein n=1 Tax=Cucumis sativus TaxID=3659 RepID=A0A0A0LCM9_CUCSA